MILYPKVDVKEWIAQHKLETDETPCVKCGKIFEFTVPFASKKYRGVQQDIHDCGIKYRQAVLVPIGAEVDEWKEILG